MKYIFLFLLLPGIVSADIKKDIAVCSAKSSDAQRLVCFDGLAKSLGVDKPKVKVGPAKGKWQVASEISQIDDSTNVYMILDANTSIEGRFNQKVKPRLVVRCTENKTEAYINWGTYLGVDSTEMLIRLDKSKAQISTWGISSNNDAVFARNNISFVQRMMNHDKLLTEITPYGENTVMTTFDIVGLSESIKPLREACNW